MYNYMQPVVGSTVAIWMGMSTFGWDKWKAKHSRRRIPEAVLFGLAAAGGSLGALLGMRSFRHKTLHHKFTIGIPLILLLQICLLAYFS